jgi:hypothetical protein
LNIQIYFRSVNFFSRLLYKELTKSDNLLSNQKCELLVNILLFFFNKIYGFTEIIYKYIMILYKEERKILDNFSDNLTDLFKFNTEFKKLIKSFMTHLSLLMKKVNIYFDFDVGYHFNNFVVNIDKEGKVILKIKTDYQFVKKNFIRNTIKLTLLNEMMNSFLEVKRNFSSLIISYKTRLEFHLKVFDVMKEDKLKNMKITSLNMNSSRIKGYINDVNNTLDKIIPFIEKIKQIFKKTSWEFTDLKDSAVYKNFLTTGEIHPFIEFNQTIIKEYQGVEKGVPYSEAVKNKRMIKELIDKENQLNKDKESFLSKVKEYEDEIKNYESKMLEEKNTSDLMKISNYELETEINCLREILKENNINYDKEKLSNTNTTVSKNEGSDTNSNFKELFEDFLKGQKNLTEEDYEILSYDVESGKQRF